MENIRENLVEHSTGISRKAVIVSLVIASGSFLTLTAATIIGTEALLRKDIDRQVEEIVQEQVDYRETYLGDRDFLNSASFFKPALPQAELNEKTDVGPKLNPLLYWGADQEATVDYGRKTPLVAKATREFLLRYQNDWIKSRSFIKKLSADLGFLDAIDTGERWDIESAPPLKLIAEKKIFTLPSFLPLPETLDILSAIKVRLIKGSADFNPIEALAKTRQLASLLLSTENFQMASAGLTVLDVERRAYREYLDRGWIQPAQWSPVDKNASMRALRAMKATRGYFRLATPPERLAEIGLAEEIPPGFCAAINEQLPVELALEDELTGTWPMERAYIDNFAVLHKIAERAKKICRVKVFRALYDDDAYQEAGPSAFGPLPYLPYFRTIFALRDWVAMPRNFDGYSKKH